MQQPWAQEIRPSSVAQYLGVKMKIIYNQENGNIAVLHPAPKWPGTMEKLAQKDVPTGLKYLIVEDSVIPTDLTFRDAWEIAESELTDGVGA